MNSIHSPANRVVFLDRDGVLNVDRYLTYRPDQFELVPGVVEGLSCLRDLGFRLIILTNQAAVGRGHITLEQVAQFNSLLTGRLAQSGIEILDIFICPHDATFGIGEYRQDCACHKPRPGMFFEAAAKYHLNLRGCYFIGDKKSDVVAGFNAGCRTILVETGILDDEHKYPGVSPDIRVRALPDAARVIAGEEAIRAMLESGTYPAPFCEEIGRRLLGIPYEKNRSASPLPPTQGS